MNYIFRIIYLILKAVPAMTGLTYNEINIVVYYFIIPLVLLMLLDRIIKKYIFSSALIVCWVFLLLFCSNFNYFSNRAFDISVAFLNGFSVIGWNYIVASVMVCVVAPIVAFAILFYFAFPQWFGRRAKTDF